MKGASKYRARTGNTHLFEGKISRIRSSLAFASRIGRYIETGLRHSSLSSSHRHPNSLVVYGALSKGYDMEREFFPCGAAIKIFSF